MNARERTLAIVTGTVLGGAALFTQVLEPAFKSWRDLDGQVAVLERALESDERLDRELPALQTQRAALEEALRPPAGTGLIPWFIAHVRTVADEARLQPSSLRFVSSRALGKDKKTQGPFAELRFELQAKAALGEIQGFLVRLAASKRHVRVVSLALSPPKQGGMIEAQMSLVALAPLDALEKSR